MSNKNFWYETHMHTIETSFCSHTKAAEHVRIYKERGYAGIIITDHLSTKNFLGSRFKKLDPLPTWEDKVKFLMKGYEAAKAEGDKIGLDVFLGWEFYANGSEFLTYGLGPDFLLKHKDLDTMPIETYSKLVRENGGYLAQAHPYRAKQDTEIPVDPKLIDAVEIYNASRTHKGLENAKAIVFAREHHLPVQAGTDAHKPDLKLYSGIRMSKRAESIFDIINAIKAQEVEPILQPMEELLWTGDLEVARKAAQAEEVSELLVKIFYDCKHAKKVAEDLCAYIQEHTEFDSVCDHMDNIGKNEKSGKLTKTIILGHHPDAKEMLDRMQALQYCQYGIRYGFDNDKCVLIASKSTLKNSKEDRSRFVVGFCNIFGEDPNNLHLRNAQFRFAAMEFMQNGLQEFLKLSEEESKALDND